MGAAATRAINIFFMVLSLLLCTAVTAATTPG
jgi:hypothetical protein